MKKFVIVLLSLATIALSYTTYDLYTQKDELYAKTIRQQRFIDTRDEDIKKLKEENRELEEAKTNLENEKKALEEQLATKTTTKKASSSTNTSYTVYVTNTGSKYHRSWCSYLRQSKHAIDKNTAVSRGYTACSRCNP